MAITITDEQIQAITEQLLADGAACDDDGQNYPTMTVFKAVENWLLRTIHEIEASPAFYAGGPMQYGNSRVPRFEIEPTCVYFGWTQCQNAPESGSVYCGEHDPENEAD